MDGVSQEITQCKGRGWALMVFSEVGGQGAWKVAQRLAAWGAQLLALDAQMAGGVASSSGGRSGSAQWSRSSSSGGNSLSKVKVMSVSNMGLWNLISLSHFWSILCNMSQIISIFKWYISLGLVISSLSLAIDPFDPKPACGCAQPMTWTLETCDMRHRTWDMEHETWNMRHETWNVARRKRLLPLGPRAGDMRSSHSWDWWMWWLGHWVKSLAFILKCLSTYPSESF